MKNRITAVVAALMVGAVAFAQSVKVNDAVLEHNEDRLDIAFNVNMEDIDPSGNNAAILIPVLFNGSDSLSLAPIEVYGRRQYIHIQRAVRDSEPFENENYKFSVRDMPENLEYKDTVAWAGWMDGASLRLDAWKSNCCGKGSLNLVDKGEPFATYEEPMPPIIVYTPNYIWLHPTAEAVVKERSVSGEAYVVFPSGKSAVDPAYRKNSEELQKIRNTIDSVRVDPDITIKEVVLKGYSSPEGKYSSNEKLSEQRTEAIREYVSGLFEMPEDVFHAESVAENWDGLRAEVAATEWKNRDKLLEIIDSDLDPDKKEARLKSKYPKDWKKLSNEIFPLLRRTDYKVGFTVRSYTTADEIREIMRTKPQNLSINEFFLASEGYASGTAEFNEVFAIAAEVFPDDPVANVNAANAAMTVGDLDGAERYLELAGDDANVRYTRGVLAALRDDMETAQKYFASAELSGVKQAKAARELVESIIAQRAELAAKGLL
ncbi:MAG: DUF3868 domain-containing protein [Bacteroidales bacterium]|nr:DUF3868 domain-containing protein [Bacteroidales bacterium]